MIFNFYLNLILRMKITIVNISFRRGQVQSVKIHIRKPWYVCGYIVQSIYLRKNTFYINNTSYKFDYAIFRKTCMIGRKC